ncbi:MAG: hypothetical protein KC657_24315, partial [Myxococcales bacterium]|nr:hypothetical protein [Myxococcales bacterium]
MADEFDLRSTSTRILECAKCDEPVTADAFSGRVTLVCGYCGFEDERELTAGAMPVATGRPYRGGKGGGRLVVRANLDTPPRGVTKGNREHLREQFVALKRSFPAAAEVDDDDAAQARVDHELALVWTGTALAALHLQGRDPLHARAALEATLELVTTPVYRALVLARLARLAAIAEAPELAEKWLSCVPEGLRVPEVASDVKTAEGLIARARGDHKGVLRAIGERDTASDFVGPSRFVALALRVDAHEKLGERRLARQLWISYSRGNAFVLQGTAAALGLAVETRRANQRRALVVLPVGFVTLWALVTMI